MTTPQFTRSEKADLWTTAIAGVLTIGASLIIAVIRMFELFPASGGIAITAPVVAGTGSTLVGTVEGQATTLSFVAPDVNSLSTGALAAEIVLTAVGWILIVALVGRVVLRTARGRAFAPGTYRLVNGIAIVLIVVSAGGAFLKILGFNGAFAAVDAFDLFDRSSVGNAAIPFYVVAVAIGAIALTFRRGEALQRDAEGLV